MQVIFQYLFLVLIHSNCYFGPSFANHHFGLFCLFIDLLFCVFFGEDIEITSFEFLFSQFDVFFVHILHDAFLEFVVSFFFDLDVSLFAVGDKVDVNEFIEVLLIFLLDFFF